jgi:hypothetical protein
MSRKRTSKGKRFWERTLKEFEETGLSVGKFCTLKGIGVSTFYQWRSHFNNRLNNRGPDQGGFTHLSIIEEDFVEDRALASKDLIDNDRSSHNKPPFDNEGIVSVFEESKKRNSSEQKSSVKGFDLHIGEKLWVRVPLGFDAIELKRLVGALC